MRALNGSFKHLDANKQTTKKNPTKTHKTGKIEKIDTLFCAFFDKNIKQITII